MERPSSRPFSPFTPPQLTLRPGLIHAPEAQVPQLDELVALERELRALQGKAQARAKKAEVDLSAFKSVYSRTNERERGKERESVPRNMTNGLNGKDGKLKFRDKDKELHPHRDRLLPGSHDSRAGADTAYDKGRDFRERDRQFPTVKIKREASGTPEVEGMAFKPLSQAHRKTHNPSAAKAAAIKTAALSSAPSPSERKREHKNKKRKRAEGSDDEADSIASDLPPPSQRARPSPHPHSAQPTPSTSSAAIPSHSSKLTKNPSHVKPSLFSASSVASGSSFLGVPGGANGASHTTAASQPILGGVASASHSFHPGIATDFTLPPKPTLPQRPSVANSVNGGFTYTPTPTDAKDVMEDFTDRKAPPNQTPINTFWKEVESWMKPVGEEDVAWLEFDADDVEPLPDLGRHYSEVWEEEDAAAAIAAAAAAQHWPRGYSLDRGYPGDPVATSGSGSGPSTTAPNGITLHNPYPEPGSSKGKGNSSTAHPATGSGWDPRTLTESDLAREERGLGPVTERLMSALLEGQGGPLEEPTGPGGSLASKSTTKGTDVDDLEKRIRAELKVIGLLKDEPDFSNSMDDDITSAIRRCRALLHTQRTLNNARKSRLLSIARDRLAYQDYVTALEGIERGITAGYQKMLKVAKVPKKKKDKHHGTSGDINGNGEHGTPSGNGAPGGGSQNKLVLEPSEALMERVRLRDRWSKTFGSAMSEWEKREPGRLTGLPKSSIYEGVEEEIAGTERVTSTKPASKQEDRR